MIAAPAAARDERSEPQLDPSPREESGADTTYEAVVVGRKETAQKLTASEARVSRQAIRHAPARSAEDLLRLVPAVHVVQHGTEGKGHQLYLRGFDAMHGSDVELRLHGIPLNEPSNVHGHGYLDFAFVPTIVVRRVEVNKGPFDARQGNFATAGSVQLRLGVPRHERGTLARYTVASTGRHQLDLVWAPPDEPMRSFVVAQAMHDSGFGENRRARRLTLLGNWTLASTPTSGLGELDLLVASYVGRFGLPGAVRGQDVVGNRIGFYDSYDDKAGGESRRVIFALLHRWILRGWALESQAYAQGRTLDLWENYTGLLVDPVHGDRRHQYQKAWTAGVNLSCRHPLPGNLLLNGGLQWRSDGADQLQDHVTLDDRQLERSRELELTETHVGSWVQLSWAPAAALRLRFGGRLDLFDYRLETHDVGETLAQASPRVTGSWQMTSGLVVFAAYGHGLRSPEARAFSPTPAARDVALERNRPGEPRITTSRSAELGLAWQPARRLEMSLAGFGTWIDRESVFDHVAGTNLELNGTRRLGVELAAEARPFAWLRFCADFALTRARFFGSGDPVPGAPRAIGALAGYVRLASGLHGGARLFYLGRRPIAHGATAGDHTVLQVSAVQEWDGLAAGVQIDNALGRRLRENEYHFASAWDPEAAPSKMPTLHFVAGPPLIGRLWLAVRL